MNINAHLYYIRTKLAHIRLTILIISTASVSRFNYVTCRPLHRVLFLE